jgi:tetratricopeptide (TPR) repeat protein
MRVGRAALAAVCVALAVHLLSLAGDFVHDDKQQILGNPLVADLGSLPLLWQTGVWAGTGAGSSFYRPLMMTSFALDAGLFGRTPLPMHAVQVGLFAALVAATVLLLSSLERSTSAGLWAGLFLAVHPVNVEPVAWISARCELLAALFGLLTIGARARVLAAEKRWRAGTGAPPGSAAPRSLRVFGWPASAECLAFFLALAAKESAVAFLPALLALDRSRGASFGLATSARRWFPAALALAVYVVLRSHALGSVSGGLVGSSEPTLLIGALGQGAGRLIWPADLTIAPPAPSLADVAVGVLVMLAGGLALALGFARRAGFLAPATLGLASLFIAASGAARIGELADRYLLVPSLAAGWLLGRILASETVRARRAPRLLGAAAVLTLAVLSIRHVPMYANDARLWRVAAERNPASERAVINLASALVNAGDTAAARPWLERAAAMAPDDLLVRLNLAVATAEEGDRAGARRMLENLVVEVPEYWPAQLRLGHLALDAGDLDEAVRRYDSVLAANGIVAEAWAGLGVARARQARFDEARAALARALTLDPEVDNAEALRRLLASLPPKSAG